MERTIIIFSYQGLANQVFQLPDITGKFQLHEGVKKVGAGRTRRYCIKRLVAPEKMVDERFHVGAALP
jgi:hypothetical protein